MRNRRHALAAALTLLVGCSALALIAGCGSAEAKPVEVTYYYLPG